MALEARSRPGRGSLRRRPARHELGRAGRPRAGEVGLLATAALALLLCTGCVEVTERLAWIASDEHAAWIRLDSRAWLGIHLEPRMVHFRRAFRVERETSARLHLRAMRQVSVYLDDRRVFRTDPARVGWSAEQIIDLGPSLKPGEHTLRILVFDATGPNLLWAHAPSLDLATNGSWSASPDGESWSAAALASEPMVASLSLRFQRADRATLAALPFLLLAVCVGWAALRLTRLPLFGPLRAWFEADPAARVHALLMMGVGALLLNNAFRLPLHLGFDRVSHYDYMRFILEHGRIPLATDGWQMFQSPLYYLLAAPVYDLLGASFEAPTVESWLRLLSIACGLWLIDLCYRTLRSVFPERPALRVAGSVFAALLPVNLWMTPYVGNEPLAACLTAAALLVVYRALTDPATTGKSAFQWCLGGTLGLALLAKATPVLALPAVALALTSALRRGGAGWRPGAAAAGRVALALLVVCGWYYGRNWLLLGSPFVGGWSQERGIDWWQDPGYRQIGDYLRFGRALFYPVYASLAGFWDGLYSTFWLDGYLSAMTDYEERPPWNYTLMLSLTWLSLPLAGVMLQSVRSLRNPVVWFSWCCVGSYLAALLVLHLIVPHYSQVKASYLLGLAPCFCVLLASGLERCGERAQRYSMFGLAIWAVASYGAFFVIA